MTTPRPLRRPLVLIVHRVFSICLAPARKAKMPMVTLKCIHIANNTQEQLCPRQGHVQSVRAAHKSHVVVVV